MYDLITTNLLGFVVGLLVSIIFWAVLNFIVVPKVRFSEKISKVKSEKSPSGFRYGIRFINVGTRDVLDVELLARLRIRNYSTDQRGNFQNDFIPLGVTRIPLLSARSWLKNMLVSILEGIPALAHLPRIKAYLDYYNDRVKAGITVHLLEGQFSEESKWIYPPDILKALQIQTITLEDLLNLGEGGTIEIFGFGFDRISGTRKMFHSKEYSSQDIEDGRFDRFSLTILPDKQSSGNAENTLLRY